VGWNISSNINCCYTSVNVSVLQSNGRVYAGGFIGTGGFYSLSNCYSLGNMFVDLKSTSEDENNYVGAFSGSCILYGSGFIAHNFSMGSLTAWSSELGRTYIGGLNGNTLSSSSFYQNNVVLGASITVTGSGTTYIGRVDGTVESGSPSNYAYSDMTLSTRTAYNAPWTDVTPDVGAATKDGADAHDGNFRDPAFWRGLGFSDDDWIFSTTVGMRHPILRASKNGLEMAGQR